MKKIFTSCENPDALLRTGEHVRIVGRRLDATHASARKPLQALIHAALRVDAGTQPPVAPVLVTPRSASSQPVPLLVTATPLRGPAASRFHGSEDPCALVLAMIPGTGTATPSLGSALEAAYGLSPAQARVAALVGTGQSPRDAAARLGLTEGTVRFQLKQIYGKLAVDGQRGLVAISTALALFLPAPRARAAD